ncbi:hypothetical protein T4B_7891 [Trichinella pseudospiralis]|uniref:Uncharacterized protein n=1 Tax=Trichinella pseudospiralis TaxID=6337 RepID=A0A0V1IS89_TRIPS|nr:hypothetical protein T4B_7891 [Trichinella pseudospiralis]
MHRSRIKEKDRLNQPTIKKCIPRINWSLCFYHINVFTRLRNNQLRAKCLKQLSAGPFIRLLTGVGTFQLYQRTLRNMKIGSEADEKQKLTYLFYWRCAAADDYLVFSALIIFVSRGIDWPVPINTVACRGDNRPSVRFNTTPRACFDAYY